MLELLAVFIFFILLFIPFEIWYFNTRKNNGSKNNIDI